MRRLILILFLAFISCYENPENYLDNINGYWEIEEVIFADGTTKEYRVNETIDFIRINDSLNGFRKKMKPGINDTYYTSDDAEAIVAKIENKTLILYYSTPYAKWKETVLNVSEEQLKVINEDNVVYLYKRYKPLKLDIE